MWVGRCGVLVYRAVLIPRVHDDLEAQAPGVHVSSILDVTLPG